MATIKTLEKVERYLMENRDNFQSISKLIKNCGTDYYSLMEILNYLRTNGKIISEEHTNKSQNAMPKKYNYYKWRTG